MHFQEAPALEAKLVRCTRGAIFDVVLILGRSPHRMGNGTARN
jgi:dTDP-4-dehydrorhamnose 3,5-epimerase